MPFTTEKRKEYSSTIMSKIDSLKQDAQSIASQQQNAITSYDDTTSEDYTNRKLMLDSQNTLMGAARELCCISNYYIDYSSKTIGFVQNGYSNIGKYITNYSSSVYRNDSPYIMSVMYPYSSSRKKGVVNNNSKIYAGNMITPDDAEESLAPIIGSASEISSGIIKHSDSGTTQSSVEESIGALNEILSSMFPSGVPSTQGIDYSSKSSYKILNYMGSSPKYPTFSCYGSGIFNTNTISMTVDKDSDCVSSFPSAGSYIICSNSAMDYYQLAKIISITNGKVTEEHTISTYGGDAKYTTCSYTLRMMLKVLTNNHPYYYTPVYDESGNIKRYTMNSKDTLLYPYAVVTSDVIYGILNEYGSSVTSTVANALSAYRCTSESCRITQYNPETNYKSMINAISSVNYSDSSSLEALKNYLVGMYNGFLANRKKILLDTINDTMYTEDLINALNSRLDKGSGSLISWYGDLLSTDDMYKRYLAKISTNASYFKRMGVLKGKVNPGKEVFHSTGSDGTEKIEVNTYTSYANSQGSTVDEVSKWMSSNPDSADAPYYIYCEKSFSDYYSKAGVRSEERR